MFSFGIIGFLAGILYQKGILKARKRDLCIYGFLSVVLIYGGIMNPASILMSYGYITPASGCFLHFRDPGGFGACTVNCDLFMVFEQAAS